MRLCLIYLGLSAILLCATVEVSAQRYPERRTTRQGTRLYEKGDFAGAEAEYRRALEFDGGLREAAFNLGDALWRQDKASEAAKVWEGIASDSLAPSPHLAAASYNLGNAALAGSRIDAAIESYKAALRPTPDDMEARFNLAYAQKLKQQQQDQDQNQDQDKDQDKDQDQNDDPKSDKNDDKSDGNQGDGDNKDENKDDNKGDGNDGNGNDPPPASPPPGGEGEGRIDPRTAEAMLDAMQSAEDDTREKVDARRVQTSVRGGKNW